MGYWCSFTTAYTTLHDPLLQTRFIAVKRIRNVPDKNRNTKTESSLVPLRNDRALNKDLLQACKSILTHICLETFKRPVQFSTVISVFWTNLTYNKRKQRICNCWNGVGLSLAGRSYTTPYASKYYSCYAIAKERQKSSRKRG